MQISTLFWGSSQLSVPYLEWLSKNNNIKIVKVCSKPGKPQGRGLKLLPNIVEIVGRKLGYDVLTFKNLKDEKVISDLRALSPQLSIVVSYGNIISEEIIKIHNIGMLNVHFSLLPKYRGAAPIEWTLINGEKITGVSIFWLDKGMDTGDIFLQEKIDIDENDDYFSLSNKLINLGVLLLDKCINLIKENKIVKELQVGEPTYAPLIKKEQGKINWDKNALQIHNLVRGLVRWPKAYTFMMFDKKISTIKIIKTAVDSNNNIQTSDDRLSYGKIVKLDRDSFTVQCGENTQLKIFQLQPENRKVLSAKEFLCGYRIKVGDKFITG